MNVDRFPICIAKLDLFRVPCFSFLLVCCGLAIGQVAPPQRISIPGSVQATILVSKVIPTYPTPAKAAGIQGTVRFLAVIGKDGHVINVRVLTGHRLLVDAAQEAVMKWVYRPTLLAGEPVEVVTQIDVAFTLQAPSAQSSPGRDVGMAAQTTASKPQCSAAIATVNSGKALVYSVAVGVPMHGWMVNTTGKGSIYLLDISDGATGFRAELDLVLRDRTIGKYLVGSVTDSFKKAAACLSPGLSSVPGVQGLAIDYVRQHLPQESFKPIRPNEVPLPIKELVERATSDPQATVFAIGRAVGYGPDSALKISNLLNIHMNQGNSAKAVNNASWRDGALIFRLSNDEWKGIYICFQNQSWKTDSKGDPIP